jgi:hypothetical protein
VGIVQGEILRPNGFAIDFSSFFNLAKLDDDQIIDGTDTLTFQRLMWSKVFKQYPSGLFKTLNEKTSMKTGKNCIICLGTQIKIRGYQLLALIKSKVKKAYRYRSGKPMKQI